MKKARFTTDPVGRVILSYDDGARRVERTFTCPPDGGYVMEYRNGGWRQVCARLAHTGNTLYSSRDKLLDMIRREYRAMRRAERREANS